MTPYPPRRPHRRTMLAALTGGTISSLAGCPTAGDGDGTDPTTGDQGTDRPETTTEEARTDGGEPRDPPDPTWTTGEKFGVGTVADHRSADPSRVWFTLTDGALTEPRFPRIDCLNARYVSILVTDGDGYAAHTHSPPGEADTLERTVEPTESDALAFRQTIAETNDTYDWELAVEHVAAHDRDALMLDLDFESSDPLDVYVVATPTPSGRAAETKGECRPVASGDGHALVAADTGADGIVTRDEAGDPVVVGLALAAADGFDRALAAPSNALAIQALLDGDDGPLAAVDADADDATDAGAQGVLALAGRLAADATTASPTVALGFATEADTDDALRTATGALEDGFETAQAAYVTSWREYLADVPLPESVADAPALAAQYRSAAMTLKAVEDKTYVGAGIASPSVPWGSEVSALAASDHGYNFVWARDLYQVFTAFDAMGDVQSAIDSLEYVFAYQHDGNGFLPQNTFVDGRTRWGGEQLDEIAFPLVMAEQLRERHGYGFAEADYGYDDVSAFADYLVRNGPRTDQERWEEEAGFSPSTIAAEIAGLVAAAQMASDHAENGDADPAPADPSADAHVYLALADHWQRSVEDWCATTTGLANTDTDGAAGNAPDGLPANAPTPYYVRVNDDTDPDDGTQRSLANGGPTLDERAIVDAGFLELVRLGVRPPTDPVVENSLSVVDETIRVDTPNGPGWYRYNGDGYGEIGTDDALSPGTPWAVTQEGQGRLWPILTGERAEYELLAGTESGAHAPDALLRAMQAFANDGRMIPEQVWDTPDPTVYDWTFGEGTASATPLAWSMAQYVRLAHSLDAGTPVERPDFVAQRYAGEGGAPEPPDLSVDWPDSVVETDEVSLAGATGAETVLVRTPMETLWLDVSDGEFSTTIDLESGRNPVTVVAVGDGEFPDVGLAARQRTVSFVD